MALDGGVRWRYEHVVAVLEHAAGEAFSENVLGSVEVASIVLLRNHPMIRIVSG